MKRTPPSPLVEGIVGALLALCTEGANVAFFKHSPLGAAIAIQTAFVGILLSLQRFNLDNARRQDQKSVERVAQFLDLQNDTGYANLRVVNSRYGAITEPEFQTVKDQVIADAQEQLRRLAIDKRSVTLQTTHYYEWLFKQFEQAAPGEYVHAVSLSSDDEWNDSQLEKNFLAANLKAAKRGVKISRIFIVSNTRLADFAKLPPIEKHRPSAKTGLMGFTVSREELERYDHRTLTSVGEGFIDFNGEVGLEDMFDTSGDARGQVTMLPVDLEKMRSIYERLLHMSKPLS